MIEIREISQNLNGKKEMKQFVKFPFSLYKNNKYWIPPIIKDELAGFDATKNPVFENATAQYFLAYRNNKIVGRIAAIINKNEVEDQQIKKMRFGWFDFIDDQNVSRLLLDKVKEIGKKNNLDFMEGPVGFSSMDKVGVLTKGFDKLGRMVTWYNHQYYTKHYKSYGFKIEKEFLETKMSMVTIGKNISKYEKYSKVVKERYHLKTLKLTKTKEILPYIDEMFTLYHKAYSKLSSFVPLSQNQINFFKKKYIPFVNSEYISFVVDKENKLVAFAILMPSFANALQKAKGKLFPFGFYHLLKAKKKHEAVVSYLIGVAPEYQNKGLTAIVFEEFYKSVFKNKVKYLILTPQLKDNVEINRLWTNFSPETIKERCTFRLNI